MPVAPSARCASTTAAIRRRPRPTRWNSRRRYTAVSSALRPNLGSASMLPAAKPTTSSPWVATKTLAEFGAALRILSHSAVLASTCIPSRYAAGTSPRYDVRQPSMRTPAIASASRGAARRMTMPGALSKDSADGGDDMIDGEAEMLEQHGRRGRFPETVDADNSAGGIVDGADVFAPVVG